MACVRTVMSSSWPKFCAVSAIVCAGSIDHLGAEEGILNGCGRLPFGPVWGFVAPMPAELPVPPPPHVGMNEAIVITPIQTHAEARTFIEAQSR